MARFSFGRLLVSTIFVVLICWGSVCADERDVEPPVAGRPGNYGGAIGSHFRVQMHAAPTELQAEDALILTVRISGSGNLQQLQRPDLLRLPRFAERFHIDNLSDRYLPTEQVREFEYRLRPRSAAVKQIPFLPFVFFNPKIVPAEEGYQTTSAAAIPLSVRPRDKVSAARVEGATPPARAPESVSQLVEGPVVLRHEVPFVLPGPLAFATVLVAGPLLAGVWYLIWRLRHPDAALRARQRYSKAAQHALKALRRSAKKDGVAQAERAAASLADYLRRRVDLSSAEPAPAEIGDCLERAGTSPILAQEVVGFFAACDAARFAPGFLEKPPSWAAKATDLVLALEKDL